MSGNPIHTTTSILAEVAHRVGLAQQSLAGRGKRKPIAAELQGVADTLYGLVDFANETQTERQRRETEYQTTGTITFPAG